VVAQPCEASWELVVLWFSVCGPFAAWGLRGKKSTPSVGWEVPVKSHRSTSGSCMERAGQRLRAVTLGYSTLAFILHGRLLLIYAFIYVLLTV
jgi:hypothetical protein